MCLIIQPASPHPNAVPNSQVTLHQHIKSGPIFSFHPSARILCRPTPVSHWPSLSSYWTTPSLGHRMPCAYPGLGHTHHTLEGGEAAGPPKRGSLHHASAFGPASDTQSGVASQSLTSAWISQSGRSTANTALQEIYDHSSSESLYDLSVSRCLTFHLNTFS